MHPFDFLFFQHFRKQLNPYHLRNVEKHSTLKPFLYKFSYIYQLLSFAILFLILRKLYLSETQKVKSIRYFAFNYCVCIMFCVLYFSALLFWFFQSTNLFVAYYSDKFNSTEKGPAQLILSLYHIPHFPCLQVPCPPLQF